MRRSIGALFVCLTTFASAQAADVFDRQTTKDLQKYLEAATPVAQFTLNDSAKVRTLGPTISNPCILVKTDDGNYTKALVGWGLRKGPDKPTPVLLIERFVTYRGDRPDLTAAAGKDVMLFPGFGFNFDIGQVVPAGQGADVEFTAEQTLKPVGTSTLVLLSGTMLPPPEKTAKHDPAAQEGVVPEDFAGSWRVDADGRWKGEWELKVTDNDRITGTFVSDESQNRYEISGQFGATPHNIKLDVFLANTQMQVDGFLWTKDKSQLAGTITLTGRKFGFHAVRVKE
jgi:hypothetical protein